MSQPSTTDICFSDEAVRLLAPQSSESSAQALMSDKSMFDACLELQKPNVYNVTFTALNYMLYNKVNPEKKDDFLEYQKNTGIFSLKQPDRVVELDSRDEGLNRMSGLRRNNSELYFRGLLDKSEEAISRVLRDTGLTDYASGKKVAKTFDEQQQVVKLLTEYIRDHTEYDITAARRTQKDGILGEFQDDFREVRVLPNGRVGHTQDTKQRIFEGYEHEGQYELEEIAQTLGVGQNSPNNTGKAVCAGQAITLAELLNRCGIDATATHIEMDSPDNHVCVRVKIDGQTYYVDPILELNRKDNADSFFRNTLDNLRRPDLVQEKGTKFLHTEEEYKERVKFFFRNKADMLDFKEHDSVGAYHSYKRRLENERGLHQSTDFAQQFVNHEIDRMSVGHNVLNPNSKEFRDDLREKYKKIREIEAAERSGLEPAVESSQSKKDIQLPKKYSFFTEQNDLSNVKKPYEERKANRNPLRKAYDDVIGVVKMPSQIAERFKRTL